MGPRPSGLARPPGKDGGNRPPHGGELGLTLSGLFASIRHTHHTGFRIVCPSRAERGAQSQSVIRMEKNNKKVRSFLEDWLHQTVEEYVSHMDGKENGGLHELIVGGVEKPLVEIVLKSTGGNQTRAANILGINRNTLRKKIKDFKITCKKS
jgi:DNA-binding protein Fis